MTSGSAIYIVVDRGKANKLLNAPGRWAKRGTIFLGEGTMPSPILDFFGINQTQKEVLLIAVPGSAHEDVYRMLKQEFQLHKRYKGIAFSVPYVQYTPEEGVHQEAKNRAENAPFVCLMTVLEKGLGSECMKVAREAGPRRSLCPPTGGRAAGFLFPAGD